jgi:hypothetical protein
MTSTNKTKTQNIIAKFVYISFLIFTTKTILVWIEAVKLIEHIEYSYFLIIVPVSILINFKVFTSKIACPLFIVDGHDGQLKYNDKYYAFAIVALIADIYFLLNFSRIFS